MPTQTNELKTVFSVDLRDAEAKLKAYEERLKKIRDLENRTGVGGGGVGGGGSFTTAATSQARDEEIRARARRVAEEANRNLDEIDRRIDQNRAKQARLRADLLAAGAVLAGTVFAAKQAVDITQQAIETTIAADNANRSLASSADALNINYRSLAESNDRFADSIGRSRTQTAGLTAEIAKLAASTGQPGQFGQISTAVADIAAARNISPEQLGDVIQGASVGNQDALSRLGIPNAERTFDAYARSIGKTREALTALDEKQAITNALLAEGARVAGANAAAQNSLEGQANAASAAWDNFTESLSASLARSDIIQNFLASTSALLRTLTTDVDALQRQIARGVPEGEAVADAAAGGWLQTISDALLGTVTTPLALGPLALDAFFQGPDQAFDTFLRSTTVGGLRQTRAERIQSQLNSSRTLAGIQDAANSDSTNPFDVLTAQPTSLADQLDQQFRLAEIRRQQDQAFQKAAEQARQTQREFQNLLASAREAETGNPFIGLFNDAGNAAQDAFEKFRIFGDDFGNFAAGIAQRAGEARIALEGFRASQRSFGARQQARELSGLGFDEIGGRPARVSSLQNILGLAASSGDLRSQSRFLQSLTLGFLTPGRIEDAQQQSVLDRVINFSSANRRIDNLLGNRQLRGLSDFGTFGDEAIARARLAQLPSESELFGLVGDDPFANFQAQVGLGERARLTDVLARAEDTRLETAIERAALTESLRRDANIRAEDILSGSLTGGLNERQRIEEFLNFTDTIGTENLDANLVEARISALNRQAELETQALEEARAIYRKLDDAFQNGFLIRLGENGEQIVRIINEAPNRASVSNAPQQGDTGRRYGN